MEHQEESLQPYNSWFARIKSVENGYGPLLFVDTESETLETCMERTFETLCDDDEILDFVFVHHEPMIVVIVDESEIEQHNPWK